MVEIKQIITKEDLLGLQVGEIVFMEGYENNSKNKNIGKIADYPLKREQIPHRLQNPSVYADIIEEEKRKVWYKCLITSNKERWTEGFEYTFDPTMLPNGRNDWAKAYSYGIPANQEEEEELVAKMKILFLN